MSTWYQPLLRQHISTLNSVEDQSPGANGNDEGKSSLNTADSASKEGDDFVEGLDFEDGNVIIRCGSVAFRVHRSLLERDNAGFLELRLPGDRGAEVENFLYGIYEAKTYFSRNQRLWAIPAASGMLRLGTKYDAPSIRLEALERFISSEWAIMTYCPELDELEGDGEDDMAFYAEDILWCPTDAVVLANLAYKEKIYGLLPMALYACCQLDGSDLVQGYQRDGYEEELEPELMKKVLNARRHLVLRSRSILASVPREGNPKCPNVDPPTITLDKRGREREIPGQSRCWKGTRANGIPSALREITIIWHPARKLNAWKEHCLKRALCSDCVAWVENLFEDAKESFLEALPRMLDIRELMEGNKEAE